MEKTKLTLSCLIIALTLGLSMAVSQAAVVAQDEPATSSSTEQTTSKAAAKTTKSTKHKKGKKGLKAMKQKTETTATDTGSKTAQ